jgi:hypothetical protein
MRVARNARCGFRFFPGRWNSNRNSRFTEFELSCGKQTTKQFSNRNKNAFLGIWAVTSPQLVVHSEVTLSHFCARLFARDRAECYP